ncbi:MAG: carbohydrate-binding domain-containing protein [Lachnospiraceae bacterium]|nr:carbohydrate-binding domain-containing protein [Lachnospiraceae bacterium]
MKKKMLIVSMGVAMCILTACRGLSSDSLGSIFANSDNGVQVSVSGQSEDVEYDESECTVIQISANGAVISGDGARYEDGIIYISKAGDYLLNGSGDASVCVSAGEEDNVRLILSGVNITCDDMAPLYIEEGKNVYLVLDSGTTNTLTDNREESSDDEETNINNAGGAVYSACDLIIEGSGSLEIVSENNDGIKAKDDVEIKSGIISITAADEGIDGNDSFVMEEGTLTIDAGDKGIKTNDTITVDGGTLNINAGDEGMQALDVVINDGDINIDAKDDGINISDGSGSSGDEMMQGGPMGQNMQNQEQVQSGQAISEQGETLEKTGQQSTAVTRAPGQGGPAGGQMQGAPMGENGEMPELPEGMEEGEMPELPEGMEEGEMPEIPENMDEANFQGGPVGGQMQGAPTGENGDIPQKPENMDGQMQGGKMENSQMQSGMQGGMMPGEMQEGMQGGMGMETAIDGALTINGGNIYINSYGDGIDSNGSLYMTGGYVEISGPENAGNGTMDYIGECEVTGGTLILTGSTGMQQILGNGSTVLSASTTLNNYYDDGDTIEIYIDGNKVYTLDDIKKGNYIMISDESITSSSQVEAVVNGESFILNVK